MNDLLKELNLKKYYENKQTTEALDRWANIEELLSSMEEFEQSKENSSLVAYLEEVSLLTDIDTWNNSNDAVTLMTVHSSKGLEFDNVFIMGLEDGLFPIVRQFDDNDIEEERRLFYVAITRSKKKIILTYSKSRRKFGVNPIFSMKSRFLDDIPSHLIKNAPDYIKSKKNITDTIDSPIKRGTKIEHGVFGQGEVLNIEGVGVNSKLTILFANNITKKLILKYANLTVVK